MKTIVLFGFALGALCAASKTVLINPGEKVTLECGVDTFTSLLEWHHRDDLIYQVHGQSGFRRKGKVDIVQRAKLKMNTKLEIDKVKEQDAGKFFCKADQQRREQTLLVVTVRVSPHNDLQLGSEATLHCGVKGPDRDPAVQWVRPDGSPHSGSLKSVDHSDAGTWGCTFSHDGDPYRWNLTIKIKEPAPEVAPSPSRSPTDDVRPTCPDCVRSAVTPPAPGSPLGLSWWVWVAVGLGFLVMVLLVVIVIVLCNRIKRKKRKFQTMKNGQQLKPKKYCQCNCPAAAAKTRQGRRREKQPAPPLQPLLML
ncbi:T-cell surface glycoprotein CD4-like [Pungitius pungitius]|uniref:T-cell surface glycoprotein CD4-like n=1 Tax=Pungitius pungitius TaxID=134920 RepID=UPI002E11B747